MIKQYLSLLRCHQYLKNVFIFLPLFFAGKITDVNLFYGTCLACISFSLVASSMYIFNDYHDLNEDKKHPVKKNRPIASGEISKKRAVGLMVFLLFTGLGISYVLDKSVLMIIIVYLILMVLYTLKLKHVPIIDVFLIAAGFVLRLYIGSAGEGVRLSMWIVLITFLLALFLALAKRRDDVLIYLESGNKARKVIDGYNLEILNSSMTIMASVTIVAYIMYTVSPEVRARVQNDHLYLTVAFVILGFFRYLQIVFVENNSGSPTVIFAKDKFIQLSVLSWVVTFGILIYAH